MIQLSQASQILSWVQQHLYDFVLLIHWNEPKYIDLDGVMYCRVRAMQIKFCVKLEISYTFSLNIKEVEKTWDDWKVV